MRTLIRPTIIHFGAFLIGIALVFMFTLGLPDPAYNLAGNFANEGAVRELRTKFGMDLPPHVRFIIFWREFFTGQLTSFYSREPLLSVLPKKCLITAGLGLAAMVFLLLMTVASLALLIRFRKMRVLANIFVGTAASLPLFISGTLLLYCCTYFGLPAWLGAAVALGIYPSILLSTNLVDRWESLQTAPYRVLEVHYHISRWVIFQRTLWEFAPAGAILFNAMMFYFVAGFSVIEQIFGIPGMGRWMLESIMRLDIPVMFLVGVMLAFLTTVLSLANQIFSAWADPRTSSLETAL